MGLSKAELNEKRGVWLALRHEHYACDVLSDWDLADGALDNYKVAYLPGSASGHLSRGSAEALREWVRKGGVLWMDCHDSLRDEYDRPLGLSQELFGINEIDTIRDTRAKAERKAKLPFDEAIAQRGEDPLWVVDRRNKIAVDADAKVLATFRDGKPAAIERSYGSGRVYYVAFYPGLSYFRGKYPWISWRGLGDEYPEPERVLITLAAKAAAPERWVVLSQPVIHWGYLASEKGLCVPLLNYLYVPQERLETSVKVSQPVTKVRSTIHGELAFTQKGGRVRFALPLARCDFVCVHY